MKKIEILLMIELPGQLMQEREHLQREMEEEQELEMRREVVGKQKQKQQLLLLLMYQQWRLQE